MLKMLGFDVQNKHGDIVRRSRTASRRRAKVRVRCVVRVGPAHQRQFDMTSYNAIGAEETFRRNQVPFVDLAPVNGPGHGRCLVLTGGA